jgi:hypothetical protein
MAKREKTKRFSIQTYDTAHYRNTEQYTKVIETLFDKATDDITKAVAKGTYNPDKAFSFDDYPSAKSVMQKVTKQLASKMTAVITSGSKKQWLFACDKNDGFINSIMDTSKLKKSQLKKMQDRNLDALSTFQKRKVDGMNLSQRVWKYTKQYQEQLEQALDVGLGEGRSAQQLSRDVRQNLKEPNRLFRRVRDKRGNLHLSKNAAAFHPGQGVYRSSYKNAMRLTRSEINMAYRESDYRRWNGLDFVVGFEIKRSNHKPLCKCKICEKLTGRYPKTFKFKGWHPQCMCYAVPILMDEETFDANELGDLKAALKGTQYKKLEAKNVVTDVPEGFKEWVKDNVEAQKEWKSTPYFVRDNFKDGKLSEGLSIELPKFTNTDVLAPYTTQIEQAKQNASKWGLVDECNKLLSYVSAKNVQGVQSQITAIQSRTTHMERKETEIRRKCAEWGLSTFILDDAIGTSSNINILGQMAILEGRCTNAEKEYKQFITDATQAITDAKTYKVDSSALSASLSAVQNDKREWTMTKASCQEDLKELQEKIKVERVKNGADVPHSAIKTSYTDNSEMDDTFKAINADFKDADNKWFEHGDLQLKEETNPHNNGSTDIQGLIMLKPERIKHCKSAMAKIGKGKSSDISFDEADAMATLWHEITHNRNKPGNMYMTTTERDVMEMMNEFVARKTLPEFYAKLGCAKTPHPEFITNRSSTGYNARVVGYDFVIKKLGCDASKVLESAKNNLFTLKYTEQETTAIQALLNGGADQFKCVNGKVITRAKLKKLVAMCRKGTSITTIDNWMQNEGIIPKVNDDEPDPL